MINKILVWCKANYEKVILGALSMILLIVISTLFTGKNISKEIENFRQKVQSPKVSIIPPDQSTGSGDYIRKKTIDGYQLIAEKNIFFPVKGPIRTIPDMNLECTGVISSPDGTFSATVRNNKIGRTYNVKAGEQVEKFLVVSVTRDVVVLSGEGRQYRLNPPATIMPFKLTGIMPTDTGFEAMVQNETTKETYFLKTGDKVGDWDVLNISENAVIISKSDAGKYELKIGGESNRIQE